MTNRAHAILEREPRKASRSAGAPVPRGGLTAWFWGAALLAGSPSTPALLAAPQEPVRDQVCLLCHEDVELGPADGGEFLHEGLTCVQCHTGLDFDAELMEHQEELPAADCSACHQEIGARHEASAHAELELGCTPCHGTHDVRPVHDADAAVAVGRLNALCARCHADVAGGETDDIHAVALAGRTCLACHDAHLAEKPAPLLEDSICLECHDGQTAADAGEAAASVHGRSAIGCVLCHEDLKQTERYPHGEAGEVDCGKCHPASSDTYGRGVHAGTLGNGHPAAGCQDCHGTHDVQGAGDPRSRVFPLHLPDTCESCHRPEPPEDHPAPAGLRVLQYETSVHGRALRDGGLVVTATCASCHGSHEIHYSGSSDSPVSRSKQPYTCGTCHVGILGSYLSGVHGEDFLAGVEDVPVCTDCHSEHSIEDPMLEGSSVSAGHVAETCARCHADHELAGTYGLPSTALVSWGRSYHGIASELGDSRAANCASCHGFHEIYPSSDARSSIHPDNLGETCGGCHADAGAYFAEVPVHSVVDRDSNFAAWIVREVYLVLITATIGAFVLFILIDLFGILRMRMGWGPPGEISMKRRPEDERRLIKPEETFPRFSLQGRFQHAVLVSSFLLLVVTGLPLFLHGVPLVKSIVNLEGGYQLRGTLHRAGAFGLIGLSLWHLAYVVVARDGRRWLKAIMIRPRDVTQFLREVMFNLGLMDWLSRRAPLKAFFARHPSWAFRERPRYDRYSLVEKLEYGAVVWGNAVMIASGALLWTPGWFLGWVPVWAFEVCRVVHGFEATLAFLAIIIWHMYHVHLRPDVFPMSRVWLVGRISARQLRHHHPLQYDRILERRRAGESAPSDR